MKFFVTLIFFGTTLCGVLAAPGTKHQMQIEKSCWGKPAVDFDLQKLNGLWYIQAYTMPGGFNSRCETSEYNIEQDGQSGQVNSTFVSTTSNEAVSIIRHFSKKQDGESFRYIVGEAGKIDFEASVKIVGFEEDNYYVACVTVPKNAEFAISVVATREREVNKRTLKKMISKDENTDYKYLVYFVDQDSCKDIKNLQFVN